MKTRIVYPQMWLDEKFARCAIPTKLLFCYLINNQQLKLSRYLHITDRQIMFDTGLTVNQLETGKKELSNLNWVYFTENWIFHNHRAAYVDYEGRDRVLLAKEQEIAEIPEKIKEVIKGLITGYKPVLNHKPEIINNKLTVLSNLDSIKLEEFKNDAEFKNKDVDLEFKKAKDWLAATGKKYKDYTGFFRNWLRRSEDKYQNNFKVGVKNV